MTPEQSKKLKKIGTQLHAIFPDMFGNVTYKFNLKPGRDTINVNFGHEESFILEPQQIGDQK